MAAIYIIAGTVVVAAWIVLGVRLSRPRAGDRVSDTWLDEHVRQPRD